MVVVNTTVLCKAAFTISSVGKHQQRHADWFKHLIEIKSLAEMAKSMLVEPLVGRLTNGSSTRRLLLELYGQRFLEIELLHALQVGWWAANAVSALTPHSFKNVPAASCQAACPDDPGEAEQE